MNQIIGTRENEKSLMVNSDIYRIMSSFFDYDRYNKWLNEQHQPLSQMYEILQYHCAKCRVLVSSQVSFDSFTKLVYKHYIKT
jgi:hypothetical protein